MKQLATLLFCLTSLIGYSQNDTTYYLNSNGAFCEKLEATKCVRITSKKGNFFVTDYTKNKNKWVKDSVVYRTRLSTTSSLSVEKIINKKTISRHNRSFVKEGEAKYLLKDFYANGKVRQEGLSNSILFPYYTGTVKSFDNEGTLVSKVDYSKNRMHGNSHYFYPNGNKKAISVYHQGKLMSTTKYLPDGTLATKE